LSVEHFRAALLRSFPAVLNSNLLKQAVVTQFAKAFQISVENDWFVTLKPPRSRSVLSRHEFTMYNILVSEKELSIVDFLERSINADVPKAIFASLLERSPIFSTSSTGVCALIGHDFSASRVIQHNSVEATHEEDLTSILGYLNVGVADIESEADLDQMISDVVVVSDQPSDIGPHVLWPLQLGLSDTRLSVDRRLELVELALDLALWDVLLLASSEDPDAEVRRCASPAIAPSSSVESQDLSSAAGVVGKSMLIADLPVRGDFGTPSPSQEKIKLYLDGEGLVEFATCDWGVIAEDKWETPRSEPIGKYFRVTARRNQGGDRILHAVHRVLHRHAQDMNTDIVYAVRLSNGHDEMLSQATYLVDWFSHHIPTLTENDKRCSLRITNDLCFRLEAV